MLQLLVYWSCFFLVVRHLHVLWLYFSLSPSPGYGPASEGGGRAVGSVQPGPVLLGPAEAVHARQERPRSPPPAQIRHFKSGGGCGDEAKHCLYLSVHYFRTPTLTALMPLLLLLVFCEDCCCCPLLGISITGFSGESVMQSYLMHLQVLSKLPGLLNKDESWV